MCAKGEHAMIDCNAPPEDRPPASERHYRASAQQNLRRDEAKLARSNPLTPTPFHRRRSPLSQPVELVEPIELIERVTPYDYSYDFDSGNEEGQ